VRKGGGKGGPASCPWCAAVQIRPGKDAWGMRERRALAREEGMLGTGEGGELRLMGRRRRASAVDEATSGGGGGGGGGSRGESGGDDVGDGGRGRGG